MVFHCFMTLDMMRTSNGFGSNPITLGMISEYLNLFGSMPIDMDLLVRLIKECDEAALKWRADKSKG